VSCSITRAELERYVLNALAERPQSAQELHAQVQDQCLIFDVQHVLRRLQDRRKVGFSGGQYLLKERAMAANGSL